jgi:hypothetical protein
MTDDEADSLIDAQLRNVAVPADLGARLHALPEWTEGEVDRELADVALPVLLAERLRNIPADEALDEQLRRMPDGDAMKVNLRNIAAASQRWQQMAMQALAASLLLAVCGGYGLFAWQMLFAVHSASVPADPLFVVMHQPPLEVQMEFGDAEFVVASPPSELSYAPDDTQLIGITLEEPWWSLGGPRPTMPVEQIIQAAQANKLYRPLTLPVLGDAPVTNELPLLDLVRLPTARGVATPLIPGYNRAFLLHTGVHPPIFPGASATLQQSLAPLSTSTDSFDDVGALASAKKRIPSDRVRTEDFIAAVDQQLPSPRAGELSLTIVGSSSPFGPEPTRLLGLGVKAGDVASAAENATHLVIAVDFSAGLSKTGVWPWLQEAIAELVGRLGPDDRVSLVFFQDEVVMGSEPLSRQDRDLLRRRLAGTAPQGEVDPAVGLEAALDLALAAETPAKSRRIAMLTDGHFELSGQQHKRLQLTANQARQAKVPLDLFQLGGRSMSSGAQSLAKATQITQRTFDSRRPLVHGLVDALRGGNSLVAKEARLIVHFAPEAIAAYRLIGHEANTMAQLATPSDVVELHAGDEALVLFELLPGAMKVEHVAEVELSWLEPGSGERRSIRRPVDHSTISTPWDGAAPPFRAATIAAEAAEQLRGSRQALRELKWYRNESVEFESLVQLAKSLKSSAGDASFQSLVSLLQAAAATPEHGRR